jgi:thiamine-monophosphate kinase
MMSSPEFDLIRRFFTEQSVRRSDVVLGIGDDAALLSPPAGASLVVSTDTLIAGVHFPVDTDAHAVGYKALAVNLSDMAAMGAEPAWISLAISLPEKDNAWLTEFSRGLFALASEFDVQLIGGDTTRGPLCLSVQILGFVPEGQALRRSGAQAGDGVFLTGTIGDAGLGLLLKQGRQPAPQPIDKDSSRYLIQRLEYPTPRIAAGLALRGLATSAIDISDGLAADLGHVLTASAMGADIEIDRLPLSEAFRSLAAQGDWRQAISAGDDYELCFTAPMALEAAILERLRAVDCPCVRIGEITALPGLRWYDAEHHEQPVNQAGFDHFQETSVGEPCDER